MLSPLYDPAEKPGIRASTWDLGRSLYAGICVSHCLEVSPPTESCFWPMIDAPSYDTRELMLPTLGSTTSRICPEIVAQIAQPLHIYQSLSENRSLVIRCGFWQGGSQASFEVKTLYYPQSVTQPPIPVIHLLATEGSKSKVCLHPYLTFLSWHMTIIPPLSVWQCRAFVWALARSGPTATAAGILGIIYAMPLSVVLWLGAVKKSALKRCFSSIRSFFSTQKVFFQHPGFSQHPRCFISTCGVFPTPEKQCFCSIRKVFFEDQVFSPHPEVFFSINEGVFSQHFFSTSAVVFSQLQNGVFPAPKVFSCTQTVFFVQSGVFSAPQQCFSSTGKRETQRQRQTQSQRRRRWQRRRQTQRQR